MVEARNQWQDFEKMYADEIQRHKLLMTAIHSGQKKIYEIDQAIEHYDQTFFKKNIHELLQRIKIIEEKLQSVSTVQQDESKYSQLLEPQKNHNDHEQILKPKLTIGNQQSETILSHNELPDNNQPALSTELKKEKNVNNQYSSLPNKQVQPTDASITSLSKSILQRTNNTINILLLGESGVGKSTFINAFVNYLIYKTLETAEQDKPVVLIPVSFLITTGSDFHEHIVKFGDPDSYHNEDFDHPGQSVTQKCKSYVFHLNHINTTKIRIIDTPGFGDTRGVYQDDANMQHILEYINDLTHLDAICFLLKPNTSKINYFFVTCLNQLLDFLGSTARENIIFCFTNARSTFYTPGDTAPLLKSILKSLKIGEIPFKKDNTFCFDNESFRYLVALQNNIKFDTIEHSEYENSWSKSVEESNRLLHYICTKLSAHDMQGERQSIKQAQFQISYMIRPMLEAMRNNLRNSIMYEKDASSEQIILNPVILDRPGAACYTCKPDILQLGKFWIARHSAHEMRKICLSCSCAINQHTRIDYELDYTHSGKRSKYGKDETEKSINLLLEGSVKFAYFLKHIYCSSKDDPFWIGITQMISEENDLCRSQKSHEMNTILAKRLTELMLKFEERLDYLESNQDFDKLHKIYELIEKIHQNPLVQVQINATKLTREIIMKQYECEFSNDSKNTRLS
ncbi:unnamed protein product [Rotaria sp. Silwood1]|nr:unnamed protein product [Rotaria sp. Silwood1]